MKKALLDYDEIRRMFNEKYRETKRLIRNGVTHLDSLAEGFAEADQVIWKLFFDADKPQTNADRIRAMSDEELARLCSGMCRVNAEITVPCTGCILRAWCPGSADEDDWIDWLQQPAEVE